MPRTSIATSAACILLAVLALPTFAQQTITLSAVDDVTLFEEPTGFLANGAGRGIFAGRNGTGLIRRALLKFEVAGALPANAEVLSATLRLRLTRNNNGEQSVKLHRMQTSWGEGTSDAPGQEGGGTPSHVNDATWIHRFYPNSLWARPGGDSESSAIASA
ncbi:MAG: DNRLRE domain-containing protein, partial [Phycisphaerales bacterium]